jgi:hypothetical protein
LLLRPKISATVNWLVQGFGRIFDISIKLLQKLNKNSKTASRIK